MKQRPEPLPKDESSEALTALVAALQALKSADDMRAFLQDLCTPAELEAMTDRWRVVPYLLQGVPYREIHDHTGVSVTTVGRVARALEHGAGGYQTAARRMKLLSHSH
jgi:TrpR-related protein YerC/YecD